MKRSVAPWLSIAAAAVPLACAPSAWAQAYPSKQILIVSSASPGSSGDAALRMISAKMSESMGQPIVVDVRTAARGAQAYAVVGKAAPDGHTLTFGTAGTFVYGRFLFKNMAFDILKDYTPVSMSLSAPSYISVHKSTGITTLKELIDFAKKNPAKLDYASTGNGSYFHLAGEALKHAAGIDILHVPYAQKAFPQMVQDWASGRVALWFPTFNTLRPHIDKVNTLAYIERSRSKYLPQVPTVGEVLPEMQPFVVWWGYFGPVGLPGPIASRFAAESKKAMMLPDVAPKLDQIGLQIIGSTPEEHAAALRQDIATIERIVAAIGLKPE